MMLFRDKCRNDNRYTQLTTIKFISERAKFRFLLSIQADRRGPNLDTCNGAYSLAEVLRI